MYHSKNIQLCIPSEKCFITSEIQYLMLTNVGILRLTKLLIVIISFEWLSDLIMILKISHRCRIPYSICEMSLQ